jgi:hypothetical protein
MVCISVLSQRKGKNNEHTTTVEGSNISYRHFTFFPLFFLLIFLFLIFLFFYVEMDSSAEGLIKAVQNIQKTNDRKAGWEGLLHASKIISGKTIRILEIVYHFSPLFILHIFLKIVYIWGRNKEITIHGGTNTKTDGRNRCVSGTPPPPFDTFPLLSCLFIYSHIENRPLRTLIHLHNTLETLRQKLENLLHR